MFGRQCNANWYGNVSKNRKKKKHTDEDPEIEFKAPAEILVLIDESGDLGEELKSPKPITMTATINNDYSDLASIAKSYPKNTRPTSKKKDELKYNSSSDEVRRNVLMEYMGASPQIYSVILKKSNFGKMSPCQAYIWMLEEALNDIMEDQNVRACRTRVDLIFDKHNCLSKPLAVKLTEQAAIKHGLDDAIFWVDTKPSQEYLPLQVHDFATGAIGGEYRRSGGHDDRTLTSDYKIINSRSKERFLSRNEKVTVAPDLPKDKHPARSYSRQVN